MFDVLLDVKAKSILFSRKNFLKKIFFEESDEWGSFEYDDQDYDYHVLFDEKWSVDVYNCKQDNTYDQNLTSDFKIENFHFKLLNEYPG